MNLNELGRKAKQASKWTASLSSKEKDAMLLAAADEILKEQDAILEANELDLEAARANGMSQGLLDRLKLDPIRIAGIVEGMKQVAGLEDPIGETGMMKRRPNGLLIGKRRVPLGVVGVIYEARPNVTADVFALTFKAGNAVMLKGGKEAARTNTAIANAIRHGLEAAGGRADAIQLLEDNSRETTNAFMRLRDYVDVLIPRGGKGLIQAAVTQATIPVIETGTGNCHAYIDQSADLDMALDIVTNGKTQRIGVCNALESLVVHQDRLQDFLPALEKRLEPWHVQLRADEQALPWLEHGIPAKEADFDTEYLDYILSVKTVPDVQAAIDHINAHSTGHSETIVSKDYDSIGQFLDQVDSAAVYANASTRFTDGFEFGFGAEIGISTQKLHARGPMGLEALTTTKFVILGNGQIR